jgi:hypothetical protein
MLLSWVASLRVPGRQYRRGQAPEAWKVQCHAVDPARRHRRHDRQPIHRGGPDLLAAGAVFGADLNPWQGRILLPDPFAAPRVWLEADTTKEVRA